MKKNTNTDKQVDIGLSVPQAISESQPVSTSPDDSNTAVVTELLAEDIVVGSGAEATSGATISVHYTGRLLNGTKFDSSLDRGAPFSFTLGVGQVIPGWDQGVQGMKVGGTRKLTIPSDLAYGETGQGPIPPNSPLLFEVELLAVE
ncbi:peptidylprolyl isomerase [Candidatus Roizmanbacteria bacterium CG22_combo_CG10-13_8_21_14_all_38_20]|uniref:Peptidyl-prolyl cis-trans isomerase n=1 Tax=Candidatus Roizmanbacteria bacterium CG22_combo_CG10-13_8_21_14_all_38_20 TaxID=1974862 RepID=A0A2H0BX15_9BACT|nr:FKBP-type peptidyl-prolyl cis-trans isomerase [Candidatus Microgenomates bacterium]PIP61580.1 MAG: peptidylprolyl isomerase [Candidatus Roizmanbacteria bacterium CG22_combo_CG10-13_8_21_14_all_38_20]PJC31560.1 MAG: peptidylprolyl isomerase [Candidatus Roizmanbacteria bacterium CG_4_9_14_0_2_um_filter_38_17]